MIANRIASPLGALSPQRRMDGLTLVRSPQPGCENHPAQQDGSNPAVCTISTQDPLALLATAPCFNDWDEA